MPSSGGAKRQRTLPGPSEEIRIKKISIPRKCGPRISGSRPGDPLVIDVSPYAGFCGGVNRTMKIIERLRVERPKAKIYLLGKVVHNEIVLARLKRRGFRTIDDYRRAEDGLLVIQSHGVPAALLDEIRDSGIEFVDTTCPRVKDIQAKARKLVRDGYRLIIIGDRKHEEVRGIAGQFKGRAGLPSAPGLYSWAGGAEMSSRTTPGASPFSEVDALIIGSPEEADPSALKTISRAGVVVQSTFIRDEAEDILRKIRRFIPKVRFENTICRPTSDRQRDARVRASRYGCVIVIGSETSANTRNLMSIVRSGNPNTVLVRRPEDVDSLRPGSCRSFYILSGASTPMDIIQRTVGRLKLRIKRSAGERP